jgi:hypothetical protein
VQRTSGGGAERTATEGRPWVRALIMRRLEASVLVQQQALEKAYCERKQRQWANTSHYQWMGAGCGLRRCSVAQWRQSNVGEACGEMGWRRADLPMRLLSVLGTDGRARRKRQETARVGLATAAGVAAVSEPRTVCRAAGAEGSTQK